MAILYDKTNNIFNLQTPDTSYIIGIYENKLPIHIHYGERIENTYSLEDMLDFPMNRYDASPHSVDFDAPVFFNSTPLEFPTFGSGDYRPPVFHAQYADGSSVSKLYYTGHKIFDGKPEIPSLPSSYVESDNEAQTLEIYLKDELTALEVTLRYTVYNHRNVITRSNIIRNNGNSAVRLQSVLSSCIDFDSAEFDFVHFYGEWARERAIERKPLIRGNQYIESLRGASSHHHNPFVCFAAPEATETQGSVYGINLVYSGNFISGAFRDTRGRVRMYTGINPFDFEWKLDCGEAFYTPESVMVYSDKGFGKMSRTFHEFIRERICRGNFRDKERPILINNWEATYYDFNDEKLLAIADKAAQVGVDLMVLDDGWFGKRNDDITSLGDWFVNRDKLPCGIDGLAKKINEKGLKFGIWLEPEMVSEDSELYRKHPDWCIQINGRSRSLHRSQLVLDFSRDDVCDYIIDALSELFESANIEYIKWDMNRYMSEVGSATLPPDRQRETAHRYMLGLYKVLGTLKKKFPHILMEGCSAGGARFDLGMLSYFDQFWTSDNTDAIERQYIQTGTSFGYPTMTMGAHVSAVPNHQIVNRTTDMKTRGYVALAGQFGYELDLAKLSEEDLDEVKNQIALCREFGPVFHKGDMYRIKSPFDGSFTVWEFVSKDRETAIVQIFSIKGMRNSDHIIFKLEGLDKNALYKDRFTGKVYGGDVLMAIGINRPVPFADFTSEMIILEKID